MQNAWHSSVIIALLIYVSNDAKNTEHLLKNIEKKMSFSYSFYEIFKYEINSWSGLPTVPAVTVSTQIRSHAGRITIKCS